MDGPVCTCQGTDRLTFRLGGGAVLRLKEIALSLTVGGRQRLLRDRRYLSQ